MVSYTVFPFKASGVASVFIPIDREDDAAAAVAAITLMEEHRSADRVTVWQRDMVIFSGPSSACLSWLALAPERRVGCPALHAPELACPPECGRFAAERPEPEGSASPGMSGHDPDAR